MQRLSLLSFFVALVSAYGLLPVEHDYSHSSWLDVGAAEDLHPVTAHMYLRLADIERAEQRLNSIADPESADFGKHLSRGDADNLFAPAADAWNAVLTWLNDTKVMVTDIKIPRQGSFVQLQSTVAQARERFGTDCREYLHSESSELHTSCGNVQIPSSLVEYVEHVKISDAPLTVPRTTRPYARAESHVDRRQLSSYVNLSRCAKSWTPECIRELYQIPLTHQAAPNNPIGIYGYADHYNQSDLNSFFKQYAPYIPKNTRPKTVKINAGTATYTIGEENLDLEMSYPIVYPQNVTLFQVDDLGALQFEGFGNHFLDAVDASYCHYDGGDDPDFDEIYPDFSHPNKADCGTIKSTSVLSISYAVDEAALDHHYITRQCHEWMKLALQGITVLVAAGDRGVQGAQFCGNPVPGTNYNGFVAEFPASCPYVTAVGATQVNFTADGKSWTEVAVYDEVHKFWSGGGFSNTTARPSWQDSAVKAYFNAGFGKYPAGTYNRSGRGIPDVAMLGALVSVFDQGEATVSGGTSAATPLFASLINRINDDRLLAGKKAIGFLNPILYKHPEVFRDIIQGSNPGCGAPGFVATKGWDPVSGLGSPVYPKLHALLTSLP